MFFKRTENIIKFRVREDLIDAFPHPIKASRIMPDWFKKLPKHNSKDPAVAGSVKACVPFTDAMTAGYIIPLWADLHVKVEEKDEGLFIWMKFPYSWDNSGKSIDDHSWQQLGELCPLKKFKLGTVLLKLINPWVIETPPGWSCKFSSPVSNWETDIQMLEAVVDTDTYQRAIHFPYIWTGNEVCDIIIPKGTPIAQVIPFKRDELKMEVDVWDHKKMTMIDNAHNTIFKDKYRKLWWHKRKHK